jgi:hypothetical protein
MGVPARRRTQVLAMLAVAAAMVPPGAVAAASDRFVPGDPGFVVADVRQVQPDGTLRQLLAEWRAMPDPEAPAVALAAAFIERARQHREPRFFGRAEALLAPLAARQEAGAAARRLYAETLQFRHDFDRAETLLDGLLEENSHDGDTRLRRASLRLTRGDFAGARGDCAQLAGIGGAQAVAGFACLAEALAGAGELARGRALLDSIGIGAGGADASVRAYLLATRAELKERDGWLVEAALDYQAAVRLAPQDDSIRAALADVLTATGDFAAARDVLAVQRPGLALLVRDAALAQGAERATLMRRAQEWLRLEAARGDALHDREAALLEIARGAPEQALVAAQRNFQQQRELADVRLLARACVLAGDQRAQAELREWLEQNRYQDAVTENILGLRRRG